MCLGPWLLFWLHIVAMKGVAVFVHVVLPRRFHLVPRFDFLCFLRLLLCSAGLIVSSSWLVVCLTSFLVARPVSAHCFRCLMLRARDFRGRVVMRVGLVLAIRAKLKAVLGGWREGSPYCVAYIVAMSYSLWLLLVGADSFTRHLRSVWCNYTSFGFFCRTLRTVGCYCISVTETVVYSLVVVAFS